MVSQADNTYIDCISGNTEVFITGGKDYLVKGTQAMPAHPSDKDRRVKTLGW
jgi:hypothetical protein